MYIKEKKKKKNQRNMIVFTLFFIFGSMFTKAYL